MEFNWFDFLMGLTLVNAMPHILFGLLDIRFLSALGFGPRANLMYALLNIAAALVLFHVRYGIATLKDHGLVMGALGVLFFFLFFGKHFHSRYQREAL